jgi:hypothetical protein
MILASLYHPWQLDSSAQSDPCTPKGSDSLRLDVISQRGQDDQEDQEASSINLLASSRNTKSKPPSPATVTFMTHPAIGALRGVGMITCLISLMYSLPWGAMLILLCWNLTECLVITFMAVNKNLKTYTIMIVEGLITASAIITHIVVAAGGSSTIVAILLSQLSRMFKLLPLCIGVIYVNIFTQGVSIANIFSVFTPRTIIFISFMCGCLWIIISAFVGDKQLAYRIIMSDSWFNDLLGEMLKIQAFPSRQIVTNHSKLRCWQY